MASVDLIGAKLETFETCMEDRLCALFIEFRLGRSPSLTRSQQGESPDRKENRLEKEEHKTEPASTPMRVDFHRWEDGDDDFCETLLPLSPNLGGFHGRYCCHPSRGRSYSMVQAHPWSPNMEAIQERAATPPRTSEYENIDGQLAKSARPPQFRSTRPGLKDFLTKQEASL
ncbi:hypothetical protein BHE74_00002963 [Ensete ventricosum]|nr:hypothetical protein BHE74_00002963 [Ensete ventricosum]